MTKSIFSRLAVAATVATIGTSASALSWGPEYVDYQGHTAYADITVSAPSYGGIATGFNMQSDSLGKFVAWCLDIGTYIKDSKYTYNTISEAIFNNNGSAVTLTATMKSNIQKLFNTAYSGLNLANGTQAGGFQLALWEIIYEAPTNVLNLGTGIFKETQAAGAAARAQANTYLANLNGAQTFDYTLLFLESEIIDSTKHKSQNLVTAQIDDSNIPGVPLPGAAWLLLAGMGAIGAARTRNRKA